LYEQVSLLGNFTSVTARASVAMWERSPFLQYYRLFFISGSYCPTSHRGGLCLVTGWSI
jgi:hypothetical protein